MNGESGEVGTPGLKRAHLFRLAAGVVSIPLVTKAMLRRLLGLDVHPFLHKRPLLAAFHDVFRWVDRLPEKGARR